MKRFLLGASVLAIVVVALAQFSHLGGPPDVMKLTAAEKAQCGLSVAATEGPFYVSGTPALVDGELNTANLPGQAISVSGHLYRGEVGTTPIANAKIEIWQADSSGSYHPNGNGDVAKYKAQDIALRGYVTTDESGAYHFTTIYPGEYTGRTRHIHFKISAADRVLTTQLIIPSKTGDAIGFDQDTIAQGLPTCALLKFDETTKPEAAQFDFRL